MLESPVFTPLAFAFGPGTCVMFVFRRIMLLPLVLLVGCSSTQSLFAPSNIEPAKIKTASSSTGSKNIASSSIAGQRVQDKLYAQYQIWQGTPHKWGGMSRQGVDCSALVKLTFAQQFSLAIPRTTAQQVKMGQAITLQQLRAGDLVFFKTGLNVRHVGIMVDPERFFHASTSKGVIISRLDNPYWQRHYWQSRRVTL